MTSDYLKQLQLTKQLEQKAKEAAKNRKTAEERLAEADVSLSQAKAMSIASPEAEKALADGQAAYAKRDYAAALAAAMKAVEALSTLQKAKVGEALDSATGVLALITEQGDDRAAVEQLVSRSRTLLEEGKAHEALVEAEKAGAAAEKYADMRMAAMFSQAQRLVDLAEERKVAASAKRQALAKAIKLNDEGDREGSLAKLGSCFKGLQESFSKLLEERAQAIMEMAAEASGTGGDVTAVTVQVDKARATMAEGRIEDALAMIANGERVLAPLIAATVEAKRKGQEPRVEWLKAQGCNVPNYAASTNHLMGSLSSGDGEGALEWLRRAEKALREAEAGLVMKTIEDLRPRLVLSRKLNVSLDRVVAKLEEARHTAVYGKVQDAMELVSEASAELDDGLAGYRELGEELEQTKEMFLQARRLKAVSREAAAMVAASRQQMIDGRLEESVEGLAAARSVLLRRVHELCARPLLDGELLVTTGWSIGADIEEDAEALEELVADLRGGSITNMGSRLTEVIGELEERLAEAAGDMVDEADRMTGPSLGLTDMVAVRVMYEEARALLDKGEWYRAYNAAEETVTEAVKVQRAALERLTVQASALLEIGRMLGIESQTLNQKMAGVEAGKDNVSTSIRSISDVILYARSLIKDELTRSLAQLIRSSSAARKNGVRTASIDRIAEEASKALEANDVQKCFNLLREAERELEKTAALHNEVYDLIVVLSRLTGELHLTPDSTVPQLLQETKGLFEAGRYDGARTSARNCYKEAEAVGAEVLAPRKLQEAKDMVGIIQQLGLVTEWAEGAINEAQALIQQGKYAEGLARAKEARKRMVDLIQERIGAEIAETRQALGRDGGEVLEGSASTIVEKAESLLAEKRYSDALRAVRFAKNEADQLRALQAAVDLELGKVEDAIREISGLGVDIGEAKEVYEQAIKYRTSGRNNLIVEMARRALHLARTAAEGRLNSELALMEDGFDLQLLKGSDLDILLQEGKGAFTAKMHQHRYTEALKALEIYGEGLRSLDGARVQSAASLSKLAENLMRVPPGSSAMGETERLMTAAQNAFGRGAFKECLALSEECRASGAAAIQQHDRCSARLEEVSAMLLERDGRRFIDQAVSAHMAAARQALAEGRYEDMDKTLLATVRLHARVRRGSIQRDLADMVNLLRIYRVLELRVEDLPAEARNLLDMRLADVAEARNIGETAAAVRGMVRGGMENRIAAIRQRMERGKGEMGISAALLNIAERSLAEGELDQVIELLREADQAVGASRNDMRELRMLSNRYHDLDAIAASVGAAGGHHREQFHQALRSRDVTGAIRHMKDAIASLEKITAPYLPSLEVRSSRLFNRGASPALQVTVEEGAQKVMEVGKVLWPHTEAPLPRELACRRVALSYRALFVEKPLIAVLEPST